MKQTLMHISQYLENCRKLTPLSSTHPPTSYILYKQKKLHETLRTPTYSTKEKPTHQQSVRNITTTEIEQQHITYNIHLINKILIQAIIIQIHQSHNTCIHQNNHAFYTFKTQSVAASQRGSSFLHKLYIC
jgi:hypothetical protein